MNLSRVLDVSLPELPKLEGKERYFRFNPKMIWRKQTEQGVTNFLVIAPGTRSVFMLTPERWELVQLFNGTRNYEQVARLWKQKCGVSASANSVRSFAESLDAKGFWLRTPEEEALLMMAEIRERQKRTKKQRSIRDFTKMYIFTADKDRIITKAHSYVWWVWSTPFVICSLVALLLMFGLWVARWSEVFGDSAAYWSMAGKTGWDVLEFYLIFAVVGFCHESGHALTAKNFGAEVHRTGMMLVYTVPAFFVETTEVVLHANYFQRMYVILAGFWFELMLCAVATFIWWGTAIGGTVHNLAYKFILVGGIMPVVFNMNPLTRLDGYLFFTKLIRQPFLKEKSTAFLSGWVQRHIFGLPAYVEPLRRKRAIFYATYAFLSGAYTYFILLFLARVTYRVSSIFTPDWAFVPASLVAYSIFKGRIEKFVGFAKTVFQQHRGTMKKYRIPIWVTAAVLFVIALLPLWRETVAAPVILEPKERAVLTAHVAGWVKDVRVHEGQVVPAGAPIAAMSDLSVEGEYVRATSQLQQASAKATEARLRYTDFASADAERRSLQQRVEALSDKARRLSVTAPIGGVVVSPRIEELQGSYLAEGSKIAEVDDVSVMRARIYVDESEMRTLTNLHHVKVKLRDRLSAANGTVESISWTPQEPDPGLIDTNKYKGLKPPPQYAVSVLLANDGTMRSGMIGEAKLFGQRQSVIEKLLRPVANFAGRKIW